MVGSWFASGGSRSGVVQETVTHPGEVVHCNSRMVCISLLASVVSVVVDMRGSEHLHMHMSLEHRRCLLGLATLSHHSAILFI